MLERRHPHITTILNNYGKIILAIIFIMVPFFSPDSETGAPALLDMKWAFAVFAGLSLFFLLIFFIRWRNTWVYTSEDTLYYERGMIAKKKRAIPFNKINTIDLRRNILEQIFGTARMKIDTGAMSDNSDDKSEMELVFTVADCEMIRKLILDRNSTDNREMRAAGETMLAENNEPAWSAKASFGDFLLYGLTDSSVFKILVIIITGLSFVGELDSRAYEWAFDIFAKLFESANDFISGKSLLIILVLLFGMLVTAGLISSLFSIVYAAIRFYGFRAAREGDNIVIRYGLISLKSYTMPVENIHACIVHQNLMQQMLGKASVEIVSVGYGNEQNETALLFPIIGLKKLPELLNKLLPEYNVELDRKPAKGKSAVMIIGMSLVYWAVFCAAVLIGCSFIFEDLVLAGIVMAVLTVLRVISVILNYKHSAIGIGNTAISVEDGGLGYNRCIIRKDAVQSVSVTSGPLRRRLGLRTYSLHYHAPMLKSTVGVSHLPEEYIDSIDIFE